LLAVDAHLEVVRRQSGNWIAAIVEHASVDDDARNLDALAEARRLLRADARNRCGDRRNDSDPAAAHRLSGCLAHRRHNASMRQACQLAARRVANQRQPRSTIAVVTWLSRLVRVVGGRRSRGDIRSSGGEKGPRLVLRAPWFFSKGGPEGPPPQSVRTIHGPQNVSLNPNRIDL